MKKQKTFKFGLLFAFCILANFLSAQFLEKQGIIYETELSDDDKDIIIEAVDKVFAKYVKVASFQDDQGNFSDDVYADFVSLFSGDAQVFNDLVKKDGGNINYASYADLVYEFMSTSGVDFEIDQAYVDRVVYDSTGFYKITIPFEKLMTNGLSNDGSSADDLPTIVRYPNSGNLAVLTMEVEIPKFDLKQANIINVLGAAKKVQAKAETIISAGGNYHLGNISLTESTLARSDGFLSSQQVGYNSYGADVAYRRSINSKRSLFILGGVSVGFHNFSTALSDFKGSGRGQMENINLGGAGILANGTPEDITLNSIITVKDGSSDNSFTESLNVIDIQVPIGISYRLVKAYNWDILVDVALVPTYLLSSSGNYGGSVSATEFPEDESLFPQKFRDYVTANEGLAGLEDYFQTLEFNETVEAQNNFTMSAQLSPVIHYKVNFRLGLQLGLNVNYGFLPYFSGESLQGNGGTTYWEEDTLLLDTKADNSAINPSILQANYKSLGVLRYGAKLGLIFTL